jgi:hypothetical protein
MEGTTLGNVQVKLLNGQECDPTQVDIVMQLGTYSS